jgi:hypothetical protein
MRVEGNGSSQVRWVYGSRPAARLAW